MTDMQKMQEEAANSARAMYRRRSPSQQPTIRTEAAEASEANDTAADDRNEKELPKASASKKDLLDTLFEDRERALLILLLILLSEDGADSGLILALLYTAI